MKKTLFTIMLVAIVCVFMFAFVSCGDDETTTAEQSSTLVVTFELDCTDADFDDEEEQEVEIGGKVAKPENPTRKNYSFDGWYIEDAENGDKWSFTKKITQDIIDEYDGELLLVAKWTKIDPTTIPCSEGGQMHTWGRYTYTDATCEKDGGKSRECALCGEVDMEVTDPKTGHQYGEWEDGVMCQQRICSVCEKAEKKTYTDVTKKASISMEGAVWSDGISFLYNKDWLDGKIAGQGTTAVTVTCKFATTGEQVDRLYVAGRGSYPYTVKVLYAGDQEYTIITTTGAFGGDTTNYENNVQEFDISANLVVEVIIEQPSTSVGSDFWDEIAFAKIPQ